METTELDNLDLEVVENPLFNDQNAEKVVLDRPLPKIPNVKWYDKFINGRSVKNEVKKENIQLNTSNLTKDEEETLFLRLNLARKRLKAIKDSGINDNNRSDYLFWFRLYKDAEDMLAKANIALVLGIIRSRFISSGLNFSDMVSDGNYALIRAIRKFDCSKGFKFSTYATWAISRAFLKLIEERKEDTALIPVSFDEDSDKGKDVEDKKASNNDLFVKLRDVLSTNEAKLSEIEMEIIKIKYFGDEKLNYTEIGSKFNISREWARQHEIKALAKLKKVFEKSK